MILEEARIGERAFSGPLSELEIDVFFTLSPEEISAVCDRRGELNRLGLALHLCVMKMTGRAELSTKLVPQAVLVHVTDQLDLPPPDLVARIPATLLHGSYHSLNLPLPVQLVKRRARTWRGQVQSFCSECGCQSWLRFSGWESCAPSVWGQ